MNVILLLAPFSVFLGLLAVWAFIWTLRAGQYDDIEGSAARILIDDLDPDSPEQPETLDGAAGDPPSP
ncbi:MAG: cbb3-type cytochrome oxidase assembly protein CcoS [Caulobacteraceae bacterium]|nr:cbb3-type cytochrome oxidase assembly protein CcoS [Caulobacteraceae bacterium]